MNYRWVWLLCAWVLWENVIVNAAGDPDPGGGKIIFGKWQPSHGFATVQECTEAIVALKNNNRFAYRCLPDTVDPRTPKR